MIIKFLSRLFYGTMVLLSFTFGVAALAQSLARNLTILDEEARPVVGARVELEINGISERLWSNSDGLVTIPFRWQSSQDIEVSAVGFVTTVFHSVAPVPQKLVINSEDGDRILRISGKTQGYGSLRRDGWVDFSILLPVLSPRRILGFDVSSMISPVPDPLRVMGREFELPSNVSLPKQNETYFFNLTLEKPNYKLYFRRPGRYEILAAHGRFPLRTAIEKLQADRPIYELLNDFEFRGGGLSSVDVDGFLPNINVAVDEFRFAQEQQVRAPSFDANHELVAIAVVRKDEQYFPSDLKRMLPSQRVTLKYPALVDDPEVLAVMLPRTALSFELPTAQVHSFMDSQEFLLSPLRWELANRDVDSLAAVSGASTNSGQMSVALSRPDAAHPIQFLGTIAPPQLLKNKVLLGVPPPLPASFRQVGTLAILSEIEYVEIEGIRVEKRTRLLEWLSKAWHAEVSLPAVPHLVAGKNYRWEIMYLARDASRPDPEGGELSLNDFTHLTRNSVSF